MKEKSQFYVISKEVLPEVFVKVMEVKQLLETHPTLTVQQASEQVGISRSSFYKYKDAIFPFYEKGRGQTITLLIRLRDEAGRLSSVLNYIASLGGNVLTINQMIPMNGIAIINICMQTAQLIMEVEDFLKELLQVEGVQDAKLLAIE
jgi:chorismate mutase